ncbi:hypothetical protein GF325_02960 [Candidatus Bathyarchaeota archaeon]|nr:hypothetical protein [Candidatus Bathyarchaeota archaeon]
MASVKKPADDTQIHYSAAGMVASNRQSCVPDNPRRCEVEKGKAEFDFRVR